MLSQRANSPCCSQAAELDIQKDTVSEFTRSALFKRNGYVVQGKEIVKTFARRQAARNGDDEDEEGTMDA